MKRFSTLSVLTVAGLFAALTSCEKDEEQNAPQRAGTASVSGQLTANLDETDFERQAVPEGTGITFVIQGSDLARNPQPDYTYEDVVVNATVDANGRYTVSLPAVKSSITATVIFDDFEFDATVITTNDDGFQQAVTERKTFMRNNTNVSIVDGQVLVRDFSYGSGNGSFVPTAIIRGVVEAQFIDNVGDPVSIELGAEGSDYTQGFEEDVNVSGGTGSGMTVDYFANFDGEVTSVSINTQGMNYTIGNVLTILDGDDNANFEITNVNPYMEPVPEGVVLTFTVGTQMYKVVTNSSGEYFAKLPASSVGATIQGIDFETTSVYFEDDNFVTGPKIYSFNNVAAQGLAEGSISELDLTYSRSN